MEYSLFSKEKVNRCKKKVIPWHVQKRYMESLSQLSLNQTISTAIYKKQIKSLQRNNKHLALTLERNRCLATDKENLLIDNGKMLDIVNFSKLKLMSMAVSIKKATECLDETISLLNSSINYNLSKFSPKNQNYRNDFKNKLQKIEIEPVMEVTESVSENSDNSYESAEPCAKKGKRSRADGCFSSANKKCKLIKTEGKVKRNCKDMPKIKEEPSSEKYSASSMDTNVKNPKKSGPAPNIKSQNRKKSLPKSSNIESATSSKSPTTTSSLFHETKNNQNSLDNKRKAVKVILTDIAEAFIFGETENYRSPKRNGLISTSSTNFKCFIQNSPEDDVLIKKCFSANNDVKVPICSQNTSNSTKNNEKLPVLSLIEKKDSVCNKKSSILKNMPEDDNNAGNTDSERDKRSHQSHSSKQANRVQFYFDEESIEKVEAETTVPNNGVQKSINKCKAKKTVSNKKKNIPSKSTTLKSSCILPDNISKLGRNSFLVTAEIHSPPNGINVQEMKNKICVGETVEPRVVLTDIFKSNRGLLSEMVGNSLHENRCLPKTITNSAEATLAVNGVNTTYMDFENNPENKGLPEDIEIVKYKAQRRRAKIVSYKEPSLNMKMRRLF